MGHIVVTGTRGFLGSRVVRALQDAGHDVVALTRVDADLSDRAQISKLADRCKGAACVVHCAGAMSGDRAVLKRDMVVASENLCAAVQDAHVPHVVLISSMAVYRMRDLDVGGMVDERTPVEDQPGRRDAYTMAKLLQEGVFRRGTEFDLTVLRPGVIFGAGRITNAHMGVAMGPILVGFGRDGELPLTYVDNCADAVVSSVKAGPDGLRVANVVDEDLPTRGAYIDRLRANGWPTVVCNIPWRMWHKMTGLFPDSAKWSGLLRRDVFEARMKPVRYSNAAMRGLGWRPAVDFKEAMRRALEEKDG